MHKLVLIAAASIALAACSSGGFTVDTTHLYGNSSDAAYVTVMRKSAFAASGVRLPLELDGKLIAMIGSGDYIKFPVSPGKHFFTIGDSDGRNLQKIVAKPAEEYYFRVRIEIYAENGPVIFERLTTTGGRHEINNGEYNQIKYDG